MTAPPPRRATWFAWASLAAALATGCAKPSTVDRRPLGASTSPSASARVASSPAASASAAPPAVGSAPPLDPNPLHLSPRRVALDAGKRVFTFNRTMLQGLRLGSTLVFYAATVLAADGDDFLVEGHAGPSYKVHAGYVIPVPDVARVNLGDPVLTEWNGVMKHAVVTRFVKDRIGVRYTDLESRSAEALLLPGRPSVALGAAKAVRFVKQAEGLQPGNYAVAKDGASFRHVLLVSPTVSGDRKQWFVLGFGGAAMLVDEADVRPIPLHWEPKAGAAAWAESVGVMRTATVQSVDEGGMFTVKFERAGRPVTVGLGLLMPPIEGETLGVVPDAGVDAGD